MKLYGRRAAEEASLSLLGYPLAWITDSSEVLKLQSLMNQART